MITFIVCLVIFIIISSILSWVNYNQVSYLREKIKGLENQLNKALGKFSAEEKSNLRHSPWEQKVEQKFEQKIEEPQEEIQKPIVKSEEPTPQNKKEKISFEQQFGARLPIWIGGIALALSGFFMVKYSIEAGLLAPNVRIILGLIFGCGLIYAADLIRTKPNFANGTRISQALSGAGIADLYVCIFAATNLYDLIPAPVGFVGLMMVTALAVALSLRHGMPIALLGLVGGFLTPAMLNSNDPSALTLFIYLYFVFAGLMFVIRKQSWWIMSLLLVASSFLWVLAWLLGGHFSSHDSICLGVFLIAISATIVVASKEKYSQEVDNKSFKETSLLNYLTIGGALFLFAIIAAHSGFGILDWGLFFLLALGGVALAFFNQKLYGLVPCFSMIVNALMLMAWRNTDANLLATIITSFGVFYIVSGYVLQSRSQKPLIWAGLACVASVLYYLLGYYRLHNTELFIDIPLFWGLLALASAGFGTFMLQNILKTIPQDHPEKQRLMAVYAATITAFISIGLAIELPSEFLPIAIAAEIFFISLINSKVEIKDLRKIAAILLGVFGCLLLPQLLSLINFAFESLTNSSAIMRHNVSIADYPLLQLGMPAVLFVAASYFFRKQKDDNLIQWLEVIAGGFIGIMLYYLLRQIFNIYEGSEFSQIDFTQRGIITDVLFVYALLCLWLGRKFSRSMVYAVGAFISVLAILRIIYFDIIVYNPIWSNQLVGDLPIFNALLITYGLPILLTLRFIFELSGDKKNEYGRYLYFFTLLISFIFISLNVRQIFHGTNLNIGETTSAEIYSYSVAWLLFGVSLLLLGTIRKDKMIRLASLVIMILTIGKVFLYDASKLEGLFRVISFLGLGLSLLVLGWFYTKFVFSEKSKPRE